MKKILFVLLFLPAFSFGQSNCTAAYFHRNAILDKLPVPGNIQKSTDSIQMISNTKLKMDKDSIDVAFKKSYVALKAKKKVKPNADYHKTKAFVKAIKQAKADAANRVTKAKRKLLGKYYAEKMKNAQLQVYDKGKKYKYVFDADTGSYKITPSTCDETETIYKLVIEAK